MTPPVRDWSVLVRGVQPLWKERTMKTYATAEDAGNVVAAIILGLRSQVTLTKLEPFIGPYEYEPDPDFDLEGHPYYQLAVTVADPVLCAALDPMKTLPEHVLALVKTPYDNVGVDLYINPKEG